MSLEGSHLLSEFPTSWVISGHACLSGSRAAHLEEEGVKSCPSHPVGRSWLWETQVFPFKLWDVSLAPFVFILMIINIIFCLCGWQNTLQIKEKEQKSGTGALRAQKEIHLPSRQRLLPALLVFFWFPLPYPVMAEADWLGGKEGGL